MIGCGIIFCGREYRNKNMFVGSEMMSMVLDTLSLVRSWIQMFRVLWVGDGKLRGIGIEVVFRSYEQGCNCLGEGNRLKREMSIVF